MRLRVTMRLNARYGHTFSVYIHILSPLVSFFVLSKTGLTYLY
jgi:hypothetical protein